VKIAILGTAPSSCRKAPFGDPTWQIWGCSPGLYPFATRVDAWFELHRWEPPVIGRPDQQVPWFTPEYCAWMANLQCPVWMREAVPEIPKSVRLPHEELVDKYGHFFFTSSIAWMMSMAMEAIMARRSANPDGEEDVIGLWGVDMAANEELYSGQRAGCQFFVTLAASMGIKIFTPPESDLMIPPTLYGISEGNHRSIKYLARKNDLLGQKAFLEGRIASDTANLHHINGALDDMQYWAMWLHEGEIKGARFEQLFPKESPS
jgi:hypothetical protein